MVTGVRTDGRALALILNVAVALFTVAFFSAIIADIVLHAYTAPSEVYMAGMTVLAGLAGAHVAGSKQ